MWFILGYIVLMIACLIIWLVACEKIEHKPTLLFVGYMTCAIIAIILIGRFVNPKIRDLENKVNELTTKLYESYSLVDSLNQNLEGKNEM